MGCDCCKYGMDGSDVHNCIAPYKYRVKMGCELSRGSNYTPPKKKRKKRK